MLLLSRRIGESILIGDNIKIIVKRINRNKTDIGIQAPENIKIVREEIKDKYPELNSNMTVI